MKFSDLPRRITPGHYQVDVSWRDLKEHVARWTEHKLSPFNMNPDFQRGHVWTRDQQIAYVEFKLSGGAGSDIIYCNCPGWMNDFKGPFVLVDGLQRLTAALRFLDGEIPAFGYYIGDFEDKPYSADFKFAVNNLKSQKDVLTWYVQMNEGGTPHSIEELTRVKAMIGSCEG